MQTQNSFIPFQLYPYVWSLINNPSGKNKTKQKQTHTINSQEIGLFYPCNLLILPVHILTRKYQSKCAFKAFKYVVQFS